MFLPFIVLFLLCGTLGDSASVESPKLENQRQSRIIGGSPIEIDTFPWIASIQTKNNSFCSGSILTNTIILTAAHCTTNYPLNSLSVRVGSSRVDEGGSVHKCVNVVVHENYTNLGSHMLNDLALITVDPPIEFSKNVRQVTLPSKGYAVVPGTAVRVAGWGRTSEKGRGSKELLGLSLPIMINARCSNDYGDNSGTWMDSHGLICTESNAKDACKGDSGGPLMVDGVQVGIISWGRGCARPDYPNVSANVAVYRDWIDGKTGGATSDSAGFFKSLSEIYSKYRPIKWLRMDNWNSTAGTPSIKSSE